MKRVFPILILALMVVIFLFSSQKSAESAELSTGFCEIAAKLLYRDYSSYPLEVQQVIVLGMSRFIRKLAHITLYAVLGALCYLWLHRKPHNISTSMGICALYAELDELHQLFVPGRSGELTDILIDCFGAACGIGLAFVILCVCYCVRRRRIVERGVWRK